MCFSWIIFLIFLWVYPLRRKSEVFSKFTHFSAFLKTQFHTSIQSFQCDNGGEYNNTEFHNFFSSNGIVVRFLCPHTSQQNGRSERMIRTINNAIRTLLSQARLPPTYLLGGSSSHCCSSPKYSSFLFHSKTKCHTLFSTTKGLLTIV